MANEVTVTSSPHPFKVENKTLLIPEGPTIRQMLELSGIKILAWAEAVVFIDGCRIPRSWWDLVRPRNGAYLELRVVPMGGGGGGGKNPLRILLTIAVMAAAFAFGPSVGGSLFGHGSASATVLGGMTAGQLGTAVVGLGGLLLVNALAPIRPPSSPQIASNGGDSPTLFIEGARNRMMPFGVVPQVLGRYRVVPPYGAPPFTEIVGDQHYVRMIFVWGIGPVSIDTDSLRIGETPLTSFAGVEVEHREGYDDDEPLTLYSNQVYQEDFSIALEIVDGWSTRTTQPEADEISVDVSFPTGCVFVDENGRRLWWRVGAQIQYRKVGDVPWLTPTFTAYTSTAPVGDTVYFDHAKAAPIRHGFRWSTAERAQYEVRIQRIAVSQPLGLVEVEPNNVAYDDLLWTALRTFTDEYPINSQVPIAVTALRIKATDQLNRVIDEFNGIITTVGKDWNGATWDDDQEITNPASLFRHVLQGNANANPMVDARLDLEGLQDWHEFCTEKGFTFNMVRDFRSSTWETLADVAGAGRAAPTGSDGKWSVVVEKPQDVAVSHITPRNSFDFAVEKAFIDPPDAWRVQFPNEDEGWRQDEIIVYRDGFDESNATKFETLTLPGVTNPEQAYRLGRFRIAQGQLQPERWTGGQDMEFLTYKKGDRVKITHDTLLVGLCSGRIKTVTVDGSNNVTEVTVDEDLVMSGGTDYGIAIRTVASGSVTSQVTTVAGTTRTASLATPIPNVGGQPAVVVGNIFGFGLLGSETDDGTVISIQPEAEMRARFILVPYRPAMFDADTEEIPPFETNLTPLPEIPEPSIRSVVSDESMLERGPGDTLITRVAIDFDPLDDPELNNPRIEVQGRPTPTAENFAAMPISEVTPARVIISGVRDLETWDFRIRFLVDDRLPGPWTTVYSVAIVGKSTPPDGLTGMTGSVFGGQFFIRWSAPSVLDMLFGGTVQFRHSLLMTGALWQESVSIGDVAYVRSLQATLPLKPGTYLARVFDAAGNASQDIVTVTTKQASVLTYAAADSIDEAPTFPGTHDGTVSIDGVLKLSGEDLMDDWGLVDDITNWDSEGGIGTEGTYTFAAGIDMGSVTRLRLTTRIAVVSVNVLDLFDARLEPIDNWEDFDGTTQAQADARVEVRYTDDDPSNPSAVWSTWERLDSAEFQARGYEFRVILTSNDPAYNVEVSELGVDAEEVV